jgi:predicted ester cyclase
MAQTAETVLHRWFDEVWNQGRESSIDELMADGALIHGIATPAGKPMRGAADFKPFYQQFRAAFPDMRITVEDVLVDGDKLAARCSVSATHTGPGVTPDPTNKAVSITGMCIARVENGKIVEGWNNFDFLSLYQQLGMQLK